MDKVTEIILSVDKKMQESFDDGRGGQSEYRPFLDKKSEFLGGEECLALKLHRLDMGRKVLKAAIALGKLSEADVQELTELTFRKDESDRFMCRLKES